MDNIVLTPERHAYLDALNKRNGKAEATRLILSNAYGRKLTLSERDELLVCRRIANEKMRVK